MKKILKLLSLTLAVALCFSMTACSSYGKLEKAFLDKGYTVSQGVEDVATSIESELEKEELVVEMHGFNKTSSIQSDVVIVLEFNSTDDLVEACKSSDTLSGIISDVSNSEDVKAFYNLLVEEGWANGNCIVFSINPLNRTEVVEIVKNA